MVNNLTHSERPMTESFGWAGGLEGAENGVERNSGHAGKWMMPPKSVGIVNCRIEEMNMLKHLTWHLYYAFCWHCWDNCELLWETQHRY